jgi:hypothetical protein
MQQGCNKTLLGQKCQDSKVPLVNLCVPMLIDVNPFRVLLSEKARARPVGQQDEQTNKSRTTRHSRNKRSSHPHSRRLVSPVYPQLYMKAVPPMKNETPLGERLAYRVPSLAKVLDLSPNYIREEIRKGRLRARLIGQIWLVSVDDARAWLASKPTNQAEGAPSTVRPVEATPATLN